MFRFTDICWLTFKPFDIVSTYKTKEKKQPNKQIKKHWIQGEVDPAKIPPPTGSEDLHGDTADEEGHGAQASGCP